MNPKIENTSSSLSGLRAEGLWFCHREDSSTNSEIKKPVGKPRGYNINIFIISKYYVFFLKLNLITRINGKIMSMEKMRIIVRASLVPGSDKFGV